MKLQNRIWYIFMASIISLIPMLPIIPVVVTACSYIFFGIGKKLFPLDAEGFSGALLGLGVSGVIITVIYIIVIVIVAKWLIKRHQS